MIAATKEMLEAIAIHYQESVAPGGVDEWVAMDLAFRHVGLDADRVAAMRSPHRLPTEEL